MRFKEIQGDLFADLSSCDAIIHGCNCFHTMGAGIARLIKAKFPGAYEEDKKTKYGDIDKLGNYSVYNLRNSPIDPIVFNAYTQYQFGTDKQYANYAAIELALLKINHYMSIDPFPNGNVIHMPRIGCSLAGGDWNIVRPIVEKTLVDCNVKVFYL
jgi:O-acetyl-ADP-ribose deacetylase (regulator of RNase III)